LLEIALRDEATYCRWPRREPWLWPRTLCGMRSRSDVNRRLWSRRLLATRRVIGSAGLEGMAFRSRRQYGWWRAQKKARTSAGYGL